MSFNFVFDRFVNGNPYPNCAPLQDLSQGYSQLELNWPRIIPLRLLYYLNDHEYPYQLYHADQVLPDACFYPIGISWFDLELDYFSLINPRILDLARRGHVTILFYYHEGDNPFEIKMHLDNLCVKHDLSTTTYVCVSANSKADNIPGFVYFADHELFYWRCSRDQPILPAHLNPRSHRFTALSRRHHSWRATVMAWLHQQGFLESSYWSYNTIGLDSEPDAGDPLLNNPIRIEPYYPRFDSYVRNFIAGAPYSCDDLNDQQHNTHDILIKAHYEDSYCNLIIETMFDAGQSGGCFLTEKTFKPIRHAQPFVIFGCANSLQALRDLGYRTFDHAIVNHYDRFDSNPERFNYLTYTMRCLAQQNLHDLYQSCMADIQHNQQLFLSSKKTRLSNLYDKLLHQLATS